jgi:hypothetical protein
MLKTFMEQVYEKLSTLEDQTYHASNGITMFLGKDGQVWYITVERIPFTVDMIQVAREELVFRT